MDASRSTECSQGSGYRHRCLSVLMPNRHQFCNVFTGFRPRLAAIQHQGKPTAYSRGNHGKSSEAPRVADLTTSTTRVATIVGLSTGRQLKFPLLYEDMWRLFLDIPPTIGGILLELARAFGKVLRRQRKAV